MNSASLRPKARSVLRLCAVASFWLLATACSESGVGRPCVIGAGGEDQSVSTVNSQALECPSRICLQRAKDDSLPDSSPVPTTALCTADCEADSDCETELVDANRADGKRCRSEFICAVGTVSGRFGCRKLCVCKDLIDADRVEQARQPAECLGS